MISPAEFDALQGESFSTTSFLQSTFWGELRSSQGQKAIYLCVEQGREVVAKALLLLKPLAVRKSIGYLPRGPLYKSDLSRDKKVEVLKALSRFARSKGALMLTAETALPPAEMALAYKKAHFHKVRYIQYPATALLPLSPDFDQMLARMSKKGRYNVRMAEKQGVVCREGSAEDISAFARLYKETSSRDHFIIRSAEYYQQVISKAISCGKGALFMAEKDGALLSCAFAIEHEGEVVYLYGASSSQQRSLMAPYAVQRAIMEWGAQRGAERYDMWGAPEVLSEKDPMWGVYRFKKSLGAEHFQGAGAYGRSFSLLLSLALFGRKILHYLRRKP